MSGEPGSWHDGDTGMRLHDYSVKAQDACQWPRFAPGALVYGVEVEVEPRSSAAQSQILEALGDDETRFFCKSDGSLDSGVEIVTVPGDLQWHETAFNWPRTMRPLLSIAMAGARTRRCGMHVHVNRRALTPLTLAKLLLCVNSPEMRELVILLAQRDPSRWAQLVPKTWTDGLQPQDGNRYQAINVTRQTAEFRIFRSSLRADRILKNLESVDSLIHFCRDTSAAEILDPARFFRYVHAQPKVWPHLVTFLRDTGAADTLGVAV
jgi:hypothetical protein